MLFHIFLLAIFYFCSALTSFPSGTYCSGDSRSECFLGSCPSGYQCVNDKCCSISDVVQPGGDCKDYLTDCSNVDCKAIGIQDFVRANCARTCNLCYDVGTISPQYACTDLLTDCRNRTRLCQDIDFVDMMALYCPRTCDLCLWSQATKISNCGDQLSDCANRTNFCYGSGISQYQKRVGCGNTCNLCGGQQNVVPTTTPTNGLFNFFRI